MTAPLSNWSVRELPPNDQDLIPALNLAVASCSKLSHSVAPAVRDLLESESVGGLRLRPVIGAYERDILRFAVAVVESPGASNLFLLPFELENRPSQQCGVLALQLALKRSRDYGVMLSQVVGPVREANWDVILEEAGFIRLTELVYMSLSAIHDRTVVDSRACNARWVTYSMETEPLFCEAIEQSYVDSRDCPELTHMRTVQQSLMSHRAVGVFDPANWFVLTEGDSPRGVLLLSRVRHEPVMEVVYMGVAQVARGRGVGDMLVEQAVRVAAGESTSLILAVDARNEPAKRLYARWAMVEIARRAAWIASACGSGS